MTRYRQPVLLLCIMSVVLATFALSGCCTGPRKKTAKKGAELTEKVNDVEKNASVTAAIDINSDRKTESDSLSDSEKLTASLYRRLGYSFEMFKRDNYDGALREVERLQLEINNDPYLEMQSWYLSAMIYHKTGKASRRKRSMRKMLESMEQLQKDPRFKKSFKDGMDSQELINMAVKKGEGKYADY